MSVYKVQHTEAIFKRVTAFVDDRDSKIIYYQADNKSSFSMTPLNRQLNFGSTAYTQRIQQWEAFVPLMGRQEDLPSKTDSLPVGDFGILEFAGRAMFGEQWQRGIAKELKKHSNFAGRVKGGQRLKRDDWKRLATKVKEAFDRKAIELGNLRVAELAIQSRSQSTAADSALPRRLARVQPAP